MSDEDDDIWGFVSDSVEPIQRGKLYVPPIPERDRPQKPPSASKAPAKPVFVPQQIKQKALKLNDGLDHRTAERLRKGAMAIDARIDLHGLNSSEAYSSLRHFVRTSQASGHRCVLVITGKGSGGKTSDQFWDSHGEGAKGVLKRAVPEWLAEPDLRDIILKSATAQPKDGGHGALYVLLRRKR